MHGADVWSGNHGAAPSGSARRGQSMNKVPMTVAGERSLHEELKQLTSEARPRVITAIAEAHEHGDLKENSEYHAVREQQGFIEGRIQEIENKLSSAQVIDVTKLPKTGKVVFSVTVELLHVEEDRQVTYRIVGEDEGDVALVRTPGGDVEYEIESVEHL